MRIKSIPKYKYLYATTDFLILLFSYFISMYLVNIYSHMGVSGKNISTMLNFIGFIGVSSTFIYIFQVNQLYTNAIIITRRHQLIRIFKSIIVGLCYLILLTLIVYLSLKINFLLLTTSFLMFSSILLYVFRIEILGKIYPKLRHTYFQKKVIIIGSGSTGKFIASKLMFNYSLGLDMVGFIDDNFTDGTEIYNGVKIIGQLNQLGKIIKKNKIEEIIIAYDSDNHQKLFDILDYCAQFGIEIKIASRLFKSIQQKIFIEKYAGIPLIEIFPRYFNNKNALKLKRIFDIIASVLGLVLLTPIFLIIIIGIKLTSKGPVIFKQIRIGKDGKPFQFFKFRSMKVIDGEDDVRKKMMIDYMKKGKTQNNGSSKIINDSRVTSIGRFLRKTSLDELPQLYNVLKGDMSIVGPRPCLPYEYEQYENWQKRRTVVKPGCTGIWQVTARSSVSFEDSILLDLYYVNSLSPSLDLLLMFKTIPVILFGKGGM